MVEKVLKTDLAKDIYSIYTEWLQIHDFSGKKVEDMVNYIAEGLERKGYMQPTPGFCLDQAIHISNARVANFVRDHMRLTYDDTDKITLEKLITTNEALHKWRNEMTE